MGKLDDGYEVIVSGASKLVGKKVKASVGRALQGIAFAALADGQAVPASPITFEAEAEKPMRASRSKKEPTVVEDTSVEPDEPLAEDAEDAEDVEEALPDAAPAAATTDGQPKKKRTRRGTRGGRTRKKPAAATAAEGDEATDDRLTAAHSHPESMSRLPTWRQSSPRKRPSRPPR